MQHAPVYLSKLQTYIITLLAFRGSIAVGNKNIGCNLFAGFLLFYEVPKNASYKFNRPAIGYIYKIIKRVIHFIV